nr:hypothetical protein [Lachnospiraceae bacterium]
MRKNKIRFFAMFLSIVLLCGGLLPAAYPKQVKASETIRYEACYERSYFDMRYLDSIRIAINPDSGMAEMTFKRKIIHNPMQRYLESEDEDDRKKYNTLRDLKKNNFGMLQCKATVYNKKNDATYGWRLTDLYWYTNPYFILYAGTDYDEFLINSNNVDKTGILIPGQVYKNGNSLTGISFYRTTAGLEHPDTGFTMLRDNFGFSNRYTSFFTSKERYENRELTGGGWYGWGTDGYLLDQKTFNTLISGLSNADKGQLFSWLNERWSGSCMGMSIVSGLLYREKLNRDSFNGTGAEVFDFEWPVRNKPLLTALQYYMWKGNLDVLDTVWWSERLDRTDSLMKDLVKKMLEEEDPLYVLSFDFEDSSSSSMKRFKHAVLAYKAEELVSSNSEDKSWYDSGYRTRLYIYDPNSPNSHLLWYVKEDGSFLIKSWNNYAEYLKPALLCFNKPEDYLNKDFKFPKIKAKQIRIEVRSDKAEFNVGGKKAKID